MIVPLVMALVRNVDPKLKEAAEARRVPVPEVSVPGITVP
jgi:hypothetical protein